MRFIRMVGVRLIVAVKQSDQFTLSTRGTSGERAGERGKQMIASSPLPSPPSDGGEKQIKGLTATFNRTRIVVMTCLAEFDFPESA